jgi:hypothetical protein
MMELHTPRFKSWPHCRLVHPFVKLVGSLGLLLAGQEEKRKYEKRVDFSFVHFFLGL